MRGKRVLGAGLACVDVIDWRENRDVSLGGTTANVMTILAQMGFEVNILTAEYENAVGKWYRNALERRRIIPIYFQKSRKQMPMVLEEVCGNGMGHFFKTRCPYCGYSLMNVILPSQEKARKVLYDGQKFDIVFFDRFSSGIRVAAEQNSETWVMYEPNAFRMYSNLLHGCKIADIVKFSSDRIPDSISERLLEDLRRENTRLIIVSLGKEGVKFTVKNDSCWGAWSYISGEQKAVVDAAGAGDWLTASFLSQLLRRYPTKEGIDERSMTEMVENAQKIAQLACQYKGAQGILKNEKGIQELRRLTGETFWKLQEESLGSEVLACPVCGKRF